MASDLNQPAANPFAAGQHALIVVDGTLANLQQLLRAVEGRGTLLVLDPGTDPLAQIQEAAAAQGPLDAIHLLTHGSSGSIRIAGQAYGAEDLAGLGSSLAPGGDLLLYGCSVGSGTAGVVFLERLARYTGADVAASTDVTGVGGNWILERSLGAIEARSLQASDWNGNLAITVTGSKVNEGSTYVPFTITGLSPNQVAMLGVVDKTTSGLVDAKIKYSFDNGATWSDFDSSVSAPSTFTTTSKLLVAVSDSVETNGSIAIEGIERYQLEVNTLPATLSFQTQTEHFLVGGESEPYLKTQVPASSKSVFDFGGTWPNKQTSFTSKLVLAGKTIGTVTFPQPAVANEFGGARGSKFVTASDEAPVTILLNTPQNYFGFWWSAGDDGNILEFYKSGQLIETFKADLMNDNFPENQLGNPYAKYINDAGDVSFAQAVPGAGSPSKVLPEASQANEGEKYAFLNFFMKGGKSFDKIVMRGSNFEFDNLTFLKNISTIARGDGTIIDDGSGAYLKLDANGNPLVDTNGNFVTDPSAFVDNDYDNTPSLNDCWYISPIDLLANDVPSSSTLKLDPTSIKLYSSATSSGTGEGGQTLSTALGEFKVTPTGVLFFNPSASFNGDTDKITIYYTVADSSGNVSSRAAVKLDPAALSAGTANNGTAPVTTPWAQTNANATELLRTSTTGITGTAVLATRTTSGSGIATATSLIVDLQTNSDNDTGGLTIDNSRNNGGTGGVQARLKVDTTAIGATSGSQLAMGFSIPSTANFGDFINLGSLATTYSGSDRRADPYVTGNGDADLASWRSQLGGQGYTDIGTSKEDPLKDYYTSQQVNIAQNWYDFDPMRNAWVKFDSGALTALQGKATATAYEIGSLTVSFQNPGGNGLGANNPLIHLANLGGAGIANSAYTRFGAVGAQLQLLSARDASGNPITGVTLSKLSGSLAVTGGNLIGSVLDGDTSYGTVRVDGSGIASVTFKVLMKGYWQDDATGQKLATYGTAFAAANSQPKETFYLSTSTFIGPDKVTIGAPKTGAADDAMNQLVSICGVNDVVVNEGSPYAIFKVGGFEGSQINGLSLSSDTGTYGTDTGTTLEYFDPSANNGQGSWIPYTGGSITIPENGDGSQFMPTSLLVRVAITNDSPADNGETLKLTAIYPSEVETGTLTIRDNGTGSVFNATNTTGTPDPVDTRFPHTALNDDTPNPGPITINSLTVNEASPYAIFTVTGKEGQSLSLGSLTSGTGTAGVDTGSSLEYWNGSTWVAYTPGQGIRLGYGSDNVLDPNADASLLVRVAVKNDTTNEPDETLTLTATPNGGTAVTGTLTIVDHNDGTVFGPNNTTGNPDQPGDPGIPAVLDDDTPDSRPVTVDNLTVNEGSPFAVFTVGAAAGQRVVLGLPTSGTADVGTDTGKSLEYYDGSKWLSYNPGSQVVTPANGKILVRVAIVQDAPFEGPQTFTITASNANGDVATGTGTIVDDGTGTLFTTRADNPKTTANEAVAGVNPDGTPAVGTTPKDDDRPISVNNVAVNEASPYIVFNVSGAQGQSIKLSTGYITAKVGTDTSKSLEVYNGTAWVAYTPDSLVPISDPSGKLLVRLAVTQDTLQEGTEKFNLIATTPTGMVAKGVGSISDDGSGLLFGPTNTTGVPDAPGVNGAPLTLWQDGTPPQTCWYLEPVEVTQGLNLAAHEYVDPASIDLDPATAGVQTSRDMLDSNNVKLGSYVASSDGLIKFVPTSDFRGTGVGPIDITLSVKAYKLDANNEILLDDTDEPVPDTAVAPRTVQHKVGLGESSNRYVSTGAVISNAATASAITWAIPIRDYSQGLYFTRASTDEWIDPNDTSDPVNGRQSRVLAFVPAGIKIATGTVFDTSDATLQRIKDAFLPALQSIEPSIDSAKWVQGTVGGTNPGWLLHWYSSTTPTAPFVNYAPDSASLVEATGRGIYFSTAEGANLDINATGGTFLANGSFNANGLPVLRTEHTFGVAVSEVCGVNNVTVNEGSPYAIFEVGGFERNTITALELSSGTGTLGTDTGSTLEYFNGTAWVAYVPGQPITIPSDGDTHPYEPTKLLVRVAITNDDPLETVNGVGETLTLKASYGFSSGPGPQKNRHPHHSRQRRRPGVWRQ